MEIAEHISCLRSEGDLLALAAERAGLDAPVPACPGWRIRDLLGHLGFVHRWAAGYVAGQRTEMTPSAAEDEIARLAPGDGSLLAWFREGHAGLVSVLAAADPAVRCWTFLPAPSPLAFWARRQAHETAIHRADAQLAAAAAAHSGEERSSGKRPGEERPEPGFSRHDWPGKELDPFPAGLAADGVDELLTGFAARRPRSLSDVPAMLVVRAEDGGQAPAWTVVMGSDQAGVSRGLLPAGPDGGAACCELAGPAQALYLLLWNRGTADGVDVRGDARVLATWRERMRVRWR
jgi:uncharacterized protein (TIGR03083 family)